MIGNFWCQKCNKEKGGNYFFKVTFSSEPCPDCRKMQQEGVFLVEEGRGDKMTFIGCLECNPLMDGTHTACCDCFFE
jgi:hypothetical protein